VMQQTYGWNIVFLQGTITRQGDWDTCMDMCVHYIFFGI